VAITALKRMVVGDGSLALMTLWRPTKPRSSSTSCHRAWDVHAKCRRKLAAVRALDRRHCHHLREVLDQGGRQEPGAAGGRCSTLYLLRPRGGRARSLGEGESPLQPYSSTVAAASVLASGLKRLFHAPPQLVPVGPQPARGGSLLVWGHGCPAPLFASAGSPCSSAPALGSRLLGGTGCGRLRRRRGPWGPARQCSHGWEPVQ